MFLTAEALHVAQEKAKYPAWGLMICGFLGLLYGIAQALGFAGTFAALWIQHGGGPNESEALAVYSVFGGGILSGLLTSFMSLVVIAGGFQLKRLRMKPLVITASIIAMSPCVSLCCLAGLPFGIWALIATFNEDIRQGFALQAAGSAAGAAPSK